MVAVTLNVVALPFSLKLDGVADNVRVVLASAVCGSARTSRTKAAGANVGSRRNPPAAAGRKEGRINAAARQHNSAARRP